MFDFDKRVFAAATKWWDEVLNDRTVTAKVTVWSEEDGDFVEETLKVSIGWGLCPTCGGKGTYVNPSIDAHGIGQDEFDMDPEFFRGYIGGVYDVTCALCEGKRVVPMPHPSDKNIEVVKASIERAAQEQRELQRELKYGY